LQSNAPPKGVTASRLWVSLQNDSLGRCRATCER
jgi:hypothetical protein